MLSHPSFAPSQKKRYSSLFGTNAYETGIDSRTNGTVSRRSVFAQVAYFVRSKNDAVTPLFVMENSEEKAARLEVGSTSSRRCGKFRERWEMTYEGAGLGVGRHQNDETCALCDADDC